MPRPSPIHNPGAHLAVPFDRHIEEAAVQRARGKRVSPLVLGIVRPAEGYELASFEVDFVSLRPLQLDRFGVRQFQGGGFDHHLNYRFGHTSVWAHNFTSGWARSSAWNWFTC